MNKKIFSVLMIGAILVASVCTFVSCKDYDDDIKELQEQITTNATTLQALVDEKVQNVEAEISSLSKQVEANKAASDAAEAALEQAIKDATNDAEGYADIQAAQAQKAAIDAATALVNSAKSELQTSLDEANAIIKEQGTTIAGLLAADQALQSGISAAQARADKAYELAEQASKAAASNKEELEKLATNLNTISATLSSQIDVLGENLAAVKKTADQAAADLLTQKAALESLKASNEAAHKALSEKDTELEKLIAANTESIEEQEKELKQVAESVEILRKEAKEYTDQEISKVKEEIQATNAAIAQLETAYKAADEEIKDEVRGLKSRVEALETDVATLKNEMLKVNQYLDILNKNLSNLITGLILQDEQLELVQAKVVGDVNKTGLNLTMTETRGAQTYVYFPYKGAVNADDALIVNQWNIERVAGPVYYTINPTEVNFEDAANISLENSLTKAPEGITISAPKASERKSTILNTRAEDAAAAPKNGLYQSTVSNSKLHQSAEHKGYENSYALFTSYNQKDDAGKDVAKKVYSKYALNLYVVPADRQENPELVATAVDGAKLSFHTDKPYRARFVAQYGSPLKGAFKLLPQNTEFGKSDVTNPKVYRKYVQVVGVSNARNVAQTGSTLTTLINAINAQNTGVLNTIFEEDSEGFDGITITIPDASGSYSFIGSTITFRYFIQNYDGTIYSYDYSVLFVKTLFEESKVTIEHTPYAAGVNTTMKDSKGSIVSASTKTDFQTEANCITVAASNKLWRENTSKLTLTAKTGSVICALKTVEFYDASTSSPVWTAKNPIATIELNGANEASVDGLTQTQVTNIKNMVITYNPADLDVEKTYALTLSSYDLNGNLISELPIEFTMKYPNHHASLINPNPAYFTPYDRNMKAADLNGKTYTAWAQYDGANAYYNIITGFNPPYYNADGCVIRFDYTPHADYDYSNSKFKTYKPISASPFKYVSALEDYILTVPIAAVKYGAEHEYTMQVAVENFGVPSLWYNPYEFTLVYQSAIAHAQKNFKWDSEVYEVGYPTQEIILDDENITSDDPATSDEDDIIYFGSNRDHRIKSTAVELADKQFTSLFKNISVESDGIHILTTETVPGGVGSITSDAINFNFNVTDWFNNTITYKFAVKVNANK